MKLHGQVSCEMLQYGFFVTRCVSKGMLQSPGEHSGQGTRAEGLHCNQWFTHHKVMKKSITSHRKEKIQIIEKMKYRHGKAVPELKVKGMKEK